MTAFLVLLLVVATAAAAAFLGRTWLLQTLPANLADPLVRVVFGIRFERNVMLPMRDGVRLATNLSFPKRSSPPYPTILIRLPYGKDEYSEARDMSTWFARRGYVVATQDMRGRFRSEGIFAPYPHEAEDGSDTIDWLAQQPWSNGKVGTYGCSALGETQVLLATQRNPRHAAMIALGAGGAIGSAAGRYDYFGAFEGGILNLASTFGWFLRHGGKHPGKQFEANVDIGRAIRELPLQGMVGRHRSDPTDFDDFASRPLDDPYWKRMGYVSDDDRFSTPAMLVNTWHDQTVADTLVLAELMKHAGPTSAAPHVIIGPGNHCDAWHAIETGKVGDLPLGRNAAQPYGELYTAMFDYWLRGMTDRKPDLPAYRFYILGEDRWADSSEWPPKGVVFKHLFLGGRSPANSSRGEGVLEDHAPSASAQFQEYEYDPDDPVPTRGGPICCTGNPSDRSGPVDQRDVESRLDVLVFTTPPLTTALRLAGPLAAELFVSSSARDTDFVVKLTDVFPDGRSLNIQEGAARARYRNGYTRPELMVPGTVNRIRVDLRAIAYYLPAGHRLRVQVSSSNFPRLERNLNTGGNNFDETVGIVANNRVYTNRRYPSAVIIPTWPDDALPSR